jgi:hypothetical protein
MDTLKQKFFEKATALRGEIKTILSNHGEEKVDEVTLSNQRSSRNGALGH